MTAGANAWAAPPVKAPVKLLVFGDSLVAGYGLPTADGFQARLGAALKADGYDVRILDGGVSGDTSAGGRARIDWALGDAPDAAIVELGANDGLRGTDPAQMQANLAAILDTLDAHHVRTLLTGMEAPPNLGAAYGAQFRRVFAALGTAERAAVRPVFPGWRSRKQVSHAGRWPASQRRGGACGSSAAEAPGGATARKVRGLYPAWARQHEPKVFCFFFAKKKALPALPSQPAQRLRGGITFW